MAAKEHSGYHRPVLLEESIDLLGIREDGVYVDVTFGGGGHSREILRRLSEKGRLIAFDRDADAHHNKIEDQRFELIRSDFKFIEHAFEGLELEEVDGILADLGISSHQIDEPARGFSFRFESALDMRMDQDAQLSATEVLNGYSEQALRQVLRSYGEVRNAAGIASSIVAQRRQAPIESTKDLERAVGEAVSAKNLSKILTLVYQALRIEVNGELESLKSLLLAGIKLLKPGGRFSIISYHSLEDRMVKQFFRHGNLEGDDNRDEFGRSLSPWEVVTRKAVKPTDAEIKINPRARSARLRAAERK